MAMILKGQLLRDLDALLASTRDYQKRLDELRRGDSLVATASKLKIIKGGAKPHTEKEVLSEADPRAWWPKIRNKEEIIREGFIKAYELALKDPKKIAPIETFWIPGWKSFAVVALAAPGPRTLVLLLTPNPPKGKLRGTSDQDLFVVSNSATINGILNVYKNRADAQKNVAKTGAAGVKSFRAKIS